MESDVRYYRRRANEEIAAAERAVTVAARERRMQLADLFLDKLKDVQSTGGVPTGDMATIRAVARDSAFDWSRSTP